MRWTRWLAGAALLLVAAVGLYAVAQQVGRRGADDVAVALGAASVQRLGAGATSQSVVGTEGRELTSAAEPFVVLYDADHHVLASDVTVWGRAPAVPSGVLDTALTAGSDKVTWQPVSGVREAVYATAWQRGAERGVVVAGVGLGPVEERAAALRTALTLGWLVTIAALAAVFLLWPRIRRPRPEWLPPPPR